MIPEIVIRNLTLTWPGQRRPLLKIQEFRLRGTGLTLISGPAGSGKSTLLQVLAGLVPQAIPAAVAGEVRIQGIEVLPQDPHTLQGIVTLLLQHPETQMAAFLWSQEVAGTAARAGPPVHNLSRGEVQRLAVEHVLNSPAPLLLLDEPFSNLDSGAVAYLVRRLRHERHRRRVLLVTHTLPPGCEPDQAFLMNQGDLRPVSLAELQKQGQVRQASVSVKPGGSRPGERVMLEAEGLQLRRGPRQLLREGRLSLAPGDLALLTGPNGAGKTTLVKWLVGLAPGAGTLRWQGHRVPHLRGHALLVPQQPGQVLWGDTPAATLKLLGGSRQPLRPEPPDALFYRPVQHLSGGEAQIAALALAFLRAPALLLLDEPTHALDAAHLDLLRRWLQDYQRAGGMVLLLTHHPALFQDLATRWYHLEEARLEARTA